MPLRRGWNSTPHSAAHDNRTAAAAAAAAVLLFLLRHAGITQQQRRPALQIAGPDKKATILIESHSDTARASYRTRVMLLPAPLAGGRRAQRCSQLVVAGACLLSVMSGFTHMICEKKKL